MAREKIWKGEIRRMVHISNYKMFKICFEIWNTYYISCNETKDQNIISTHIRQISILSLIKMLCNISLCVKYVSIHINVKMFWMTRTMAQYYCHYTLLRFYLFLFWWVRRINIFNSLFQTLSYVFNAATESLPSPSGAIG